MEDTTTKKQKSTKNASPTTSTPCTPDSVNLGDNDNYDVVERPVGRKAAKKNKAKDLGNNVTESPFVKLLEEMKIRLPRSLHRLFSAPPIAFTAYSPPPLPRHSSPPPDPPKPLLDLFGTLWTTAIATTSLLPRRTLHVSPSSTDSSTTAITTASSSSPFITSVLSSSQQISRKPYLPLCYRCLARSGVKDRPIAILRREGERKREFETKLGETQNKLHKFASFLPQYFDGYGYHGTSFKQTYRCYPASFIDKPQIENGDKIIMPLSALDRLASLHIDYPMLFELRNAATECISHCGVLEFIAEEGMIYMPYWMMENLLLQEGDIVLTHPIFCLERCD
ncbi:Ubiquitin recognition factor in ER-associated degradation protein 1 [Camellia lanceoleosa]|uniref:Ubiquitin recognition factor in ER-associated degradation protein 1 n=1 Tax=Camellia lanceoleosa TaxID=1840588 RepID=A0ACC0H3Z1_9ERIC|nr:Ubiquitin recognition factor in ER-associated degradation protein 1 [Camellia lanceoleosa]